ncbi:MAG: succinate--CoA ligase subunit beta [Spirulina sp. SIO3F2]|nr:succinate--CoA ligase subunit beta [Spirulina sp. SIO3F2]
MELLEYQAKTLFREVGIPVPLSQQIEQPRELKQLQIPYPVVLKSQVRAEGRSQAGGVQFVENTIDAIAAAQTLLSLPIGGECPELLLAEARYQAEQELYLAVVLDYHHQLPLLLGSTHGAINLEHPAAHIQTVPVDGDFSPFYARRLAIHMGLRGDRIAIISRIVEKMYHLFARKDLDMVAINPLGLKANGQVMALDGKITLSAAAIARHPELKLILDIAPPPRRVSSSYRPIGQQRQGKTGILCTDVGLGMMVWDTLAAARCPVGSCVSLTAEDNLSTALNRTLEQWQANGQYHKVIMALPREEVMDITIEAILAAIPATLQLTLYSPGLSLTEQSAALSCATSLAEVVGLVKSG